MLAGNTFVKIMNPRSAVPIPRLLARGGLVGALPCRKPPKGRQEITSDHHLRNTLGGRAGTLRQSRISLMILSSRRRSITDQRQERSSYFRAKISSAMASLTRCLLLHAHQGKVTAGLNRSWLPTPQTSWGGLAATATLTYRPEERHSDNLVMF